MEQINLIARPHSSHLHVEKKRAGANIARQLDNTFAHLRIVQKLTTQLHKKVDNSSSDRPFPIFTREVVKFHPLLYLHFIL